MKLNVLIALSLILFTSANFCFGQANLVQNGTFNESIADSMEMWEGRYIGLHFDRGTVPLSPLGFQYPESDSGYIGLELYSVLPLSLQSNFFALSRLSSTIFPGDMIEVRYSISLADESAFFGGAPMFSFFDGKPDSTAIVDELNEFSIRGVGSVVDTTNTWRTESITIMATDTVDWLSISKSTSFPGPIEGPQTYQVGAMYFLDNIQVISSNTVGTSDSFAEEWTPLDTYNMRGSTWKNGDGIKIQPQKSNYGNYRTIKTYQPK